jgi:hypothetical protein
LVCNVSQKGDMYLIACLGVRLSTVNSSLRRHVEISRKSRIALLVNTSGNKRTHEELVTCSRPTALPPLCHLNLCSFGIHLTPPVVTFPKVACMTSFRISAELRGGTMDEDLRCGRSARGSFLFISWERKRAAGLTSR